MTGMKSSLISMHTGIAIGDKQHETTAADEYTADTEYMPFPYLEDNSIF